MKRCKYTYWFNLCSQSNEICLLVSDRLSNIINHISDLNIYRFNLFVLIGNAAKSAALRELFGVKRSRRFAAKRSAGEIHLYVDPSSISHGRPVFIADGNLSSKSLQGKIFMDKYYEITKRIIRRLSEGFSLD